MIPIFLKASIIFRAVLTLPRHIWVKGDDAKNGLLRKGSVHIAEPWYATAASFLEEAERSTFRSKRSIESSGGVASSCDPDDETTSRDPIGAAIVRSSCNFFPTTVLMLSAHFVLGHSSFQLRIGNAKYRMLHYRQIWLTIQRRFFNQGDIVEPHFR